MRFNMNQYVKVKLTDVGREKLQQDHQKLYSTFKSSREFRLPKEDEDGWSKWQMWHLFEAFGPHIHLGARIPFETEIELIDEDFPNAGTE